MTARTDGILDRVRTPADAVARAFPRGAGHMETE